ncbi:MAG: hypothetical protein HZB59_00085 [Ignavibacteriales bacterium]|nr:hypothetical protein [Ignavibacteriales bacterium]
MNKYIMKTIYGVFILYLAMPFLCFAGKTIPLSPVNGKETKLIINGKEKTYYLLSKDTPIKIKVGGPTKLEILTRLGLKSDNSSEGIYSIKVSEQNKVVKLYSTTTSKSDASFKNLNIIPGKSRKFSLDVPIGMHTYDLSLDSKDFSMAALKFSVNSKNKKNRSSEVDLQPLVYDKVVTAVIKEKLITYYTCSKQKSVQIRIVGPTKLQVVGRLNFDSAMKGLQTYSVSIWENDTRILMKPLTTTKSLGITYQDMLDVVPGKPDKINLDIPSGEHLYKIKLEETAAHSIAFKFSIPKKDMNNEE